MLDRVTSRGMRYVAQRLGLLLIFACMLLASAGQLDWRRGWAYLLVVFLLEAFALTVLAVLAPETLNERGTFHAGVKPFDRAFAALWLLLALCTPVVAGLDAVRIQGERGHRAVTSGPYRFVRHPGYLGAVLGALATPLMLGSAWTFVPAGLVALLFVVRTHLEDQTLRRELQGYEEYTKRTRFRLVPWVW